jgi:hypothetical protein
VIEGSFTTKRPEPNDVDCAVMVGPDVEPDREVDSFEDIPYLHVFVLSIDAFDDFVEKIFGIDRQCNPKGFIEATSWN